MEFTEKELTVYYKGKPQYKLNPGFIKQQEIKDIETIKELLLTHEDRCRIFEAMENTDDSVKLHVLAQEREHIEYRLQKVWGFPEDSNWHRWWEVPKCTCPKLDNYDNYPTKYRIINENCPVHGSLPKDSSIFRDILNFIKDIFSLKF